MTWRKNIQPIQLSTDEDPRAAAGKIDGLFEVLVMSSDGIVCSNLIHRAEADTERSGILLAAAASALCELLHFSADIPFSLTCQSSSANFLLRSVSPNQLLYSVFQSGFPLNLAAYQAAHLTDAAHRGGLRKSSASI
ncbi:MAG: hypothetical protein JO308_02260, partial [Verrucomicrobia bacterium]|nr:hypothetical protein [Verrucomicrobiota bacterium]